VSDLGNALAGLGIFFAGSRLLRSHLQQLGSGSIHSLLTRSLGYRWAPPLAGLLSGALTQSATACTFVAAGLVGAGTLSIEVALRMLAWANLGTSALVLFAAIDIRNVVYLLLAAIGLCFVSGLERVDRYRHAMLAALGLGLLLLGLMMVKTSFSALFDVSMVRHLMGGSTVGPLTAFLAGFVIAAVLQSSSLVTILAIPVIQLGLLQTHQVVLLVYGAGAGSGIATALLATGLTGRARQLAWCQAGLRLFATLLLLVLYAVEWATHVPLIVSLLQRVSPTTAEFGGLTYALFQLVALATAAVLVRPLVAMTAHLGTPSEAEVLARPAYLFDKAATDPATALDLVRLEHQRLVGFLPTFLDDLRPAEERGPGSYPLAKRWAASNAIATAIDRFLASMIHANPEMLEIREVFEAQTRLLALRTLQDTLGEFTTELLKIPAAQRPAFAHSLIEGLHAVLMVAADSAGQDDTESAQLLLELTAERGSLMDRVRREISGGGAFAGHDSLLSATLTFERILWMLRRLHPVPAEPHDNEPRAVTT
jgi:phosphate:Na+ symporter